MTFCKPAQVIASEKLSPSLKRIRLRLVGDWKWHVNGLGDERIDISFPLPGETVADFEYFNRPDYGQPADEPGPPWRHYTVRAVHDGGKEIDVDFVLHDGGIASSWAERAEPGHIVGLFTGSEHPRAYYAPPAQHDWQLLVADATGLPGLARILEDLPAGLSVQAVAEVPTEEDQLPLKSAATIQWTWLVGSGGLDSQLPEAVAQLQLPAGDGYAWVACEAAAARRIRSTLRKQHGMPRDSHRAVGYWTAGREGHVD